MPDEKKPKKDKKLFELGPMEQVLIILGIMAFGAHPSMPWSLAGGTLTSIPLFSPATLMLVFIAYFGFHLLKRQEAERDRQKALAKAKAKAKSSSSSSSSSSRSRSAMTSEQVRAKGGMSSSAMNPRTGNPAPKQVSKSSKTNPASNTFHGNYFMTMNGPGRPALVPRQSGLRPKEGEEAGTMWWDNVPDDAKALMAPPVDADAEKKRAKEMTNPWAVDATKKDISLMKLEKERKEEEARFEKVGNILQTLLSLLLCLVDMRLGLVAIIFFLWRHYTIQHERENDGEKEARQKEIKEIQIKIKEAQVSGADPNDIHFMQMDLQKLM